MPVIRHGKLFQTRIISWYLTTWFAILQGHCFKEEKQHYEAAEKEFLHEIYSYTSSDTIFSLFDSKQFTQIVQRYTQLDILMRTLQPHMLISTAGFMGYVDRHMTETCIKAYEEIRTATTEANYLQFDSIKYWFGLYPVSIPLIYLILCDLGLVSFVTQKKRTIQKTNKHIYIYIYIHWLE